MGSNNPYRRAAGLYDRGLSLPGIARIRREEAEVVCAALARCSADCGSALEVGPGTGFYTRLLARTIPRVTAVEDSTQMTDLLRHKLAADDVRNVDVVNADFRTLAVEERFDLVIAIGVLDYIPEPQPFVDRMCALATKAVVFTVPQRGLLGSCFAAGNCLRRIAVYRHPKPGLEAWAPGWRCAVTEVGLKTLVTKGLTLVAVLERI